MLENRNKGKLLSIHSSLSRLYFAIDRPCQLFVLAVQTADRCAWRERRRRNEEGAWHTHDTLVATHRALCTGIRHKADERDPPSVERVSETRCTRLDTEENGWKSRADLRQLLVRKVHVRIRIGDRKGSASAESCQHFATRSKDSNSTPGYGVHPSVAEEQCHAQAAPAPPPVHPSIGQTIGKRREQFAAITSRQQWRHRDRICNVEQQQQRWKGNKVNFSGRARNSTIDESGRSVKGHFHERPPCL